MLLYTSIIIAFGCNDDDEIILSNELQLKITLNNANVDITYNQSHVPINSLEYEWAIFFDTDDDVTTGNSDGYDVRVSMSYFKFDSIPVTGSLLSKTQINTWILSKQGGSFGNLISTQLDSQNNVLIFNISRNWNELKQLSTGDRFYALTRYFSPTGQALDITTVETVPNLLTDGKDDVPYEFIDLISIEIVSKN